MTDAKAFQGLDEEFASRVREALTEMRYWVAKHRPNCDWVITEGKRSYARQVALYAQGRTKPGPKVTWTLKSKHIQGLAVDGAIVKPGGIDWEDLEAFRFWGHCLRNAGLIWGGDFKGTPDMPHAEMPTG